MTDAMSDDVKLLYEGAVVPVTHLFDEFGIDVDRWIDASRFVAGPLPDGRWLSADCADFSGVEGTVITVPIIQAMTLGLLRLAAMGLGAWLYVTYPANPTIALAAAGLLGFAITGTAVDVLKVARQVSAAQTTTTATLTQPADTAAPSTLTAKIEPATPPQ